MQNRQDKMEKDINDLMNDLKKEINAMKRVLIIPAKTVLVA